MENLLPTPPWFDLLNSMQKEWREIELERGRNPDPYIEQLLSDAGRWSNHAKLRRPN